MSGKRSHHVCAYRGCENKGYSIEEGIKFFRFPKNSVMCQKWIHLSGREDLSSKSCVQLYGSYRLCSIHFEDTMFVNSFSKNRLLPTALPKSYVVKGDESSIEPERIFVFTEPGTSSATQVFRAPEEVALDLEQSTGTKRKLQEHSEAKSKIRILEDISLGFQSSGTEVMGMSSQISVPSTSRSVTPPLSSPAGTQTDLALSKRTPRKEKLNEKVQRLQQENKTLKKEIEDLQKQQQVEAEITQFESLCDKLLPKDLSVFVKTQLKQINRTAHGRRYSTEFKSFALSLYFLGPRCYRQLQKTFCLPSPRALQRFVGQVQFAPGLNDSLFKFLELKVEHMAPEEKFCSLCIDEMALKTNLFYNFGRDQVIGLEDDGKTRTLTPANTASVVMVRGIRSNWKQPLGYIFTSTCCKADDARKLLEEFVVKLCNIGLNVLLLVTDMGSNFWQMAKNLGVTPEDPSFILGDRELLYYFDPSHLIKATKNTVLEKEVQWENKRTSWKYVVDFYNRDKELNNRLAPKLTNSHINPTTFEKMRVKLATQVLSATVAAGLQTYIELNALPRDAIGTVEYISHFDKLFDVFNSSTLNAHKPLAKPFSGESYQIAFLQTSATFLEKLKVFNEQGKDVTKYNRCFRGWLISIQSLIRLWDILKNQNFSFILTRRISQDALENFFGSVRQQGGNAVNPTAAQFSRAFRKLFLINYLHSEGMNCSEDFAKLLISINDFNGNPSAISSIIATESDGQPFEVSNCDYHDKPIPEQNAFKYVCGYLIKKCLQKHSCSLCKKFATDNDNLDDTTLFINFKAYKKDYTNLFGALNTPQESFYNFVYCLETVFFQNIEDTLIHSRVGYNMYLKCKQIQGFQHPCQAFPLDYLIKLFIRFRLFYVMKFSNRDFKFAPKKNRKICIVMNL